MEKRKQQKIQLELQIILAVVASLHYPNCDEIKMSKSRLLFLTRLAGVLVLSLAFLFQPVPSFAQSTQVGVTSIERYTLPTIKLRTAQERALPGAVRDDRGLHLGGIFSGLYHAPGEPENVFYAIADRGPNSRIDVGNERRRTFPVPDYNPTIYKLSVTGDRIEIIDRTPILTTSNQPVTGLPNTDNDEVPYSYDGQTRLQINPNGLDPEGLARATDGTFWIGDEYGPSVVQVAPDGKVLHRLIPKGEISSNTNVRSVLPAIYAKRRLNRGFEGLTISQDGKSLFIALQSPLDFPTKKIGRASRQIRLLVVDTQKLLPVAEYVYVAESARSFGATKQGKLKIGDLAFVNPTTLLVVERTNKVARIYQVDLSSATNILETRWSDPQNTTEVLEALTPGQLAANGMTPVSKSLVVDLSQIPEIPKKIEGLTIVNPKAIALGNDNDFGFDRFDANGRAVNNTIPSQLLILRLSQALPLAR